MMKRLLFFIVSAAFTWHANAQDSIRVWNKWSNKKDSMLLFNGSYNLIEFYSNTLHPDEMKLKGIDQSLRIGKPEIKGDTLSVMAMPYPGKSKNMRIAILNKKTSKIIKTINFSSTDVPTPIAKLGNIQSQEAYKKDLLMQSVLRVVFPGSLYCYPYHIKQYTFKLQSTKGTTTATVNGIFLTKDVLQAISEAPEGAIAEFTNIKATCPECTERTLDDIKIKIK